MTIDVKRFQAIDFVNDNRIDDPTSSRDERLRHAYQRGYADGAGDAAARAEESIAQAMQTLGETLAATGAEAQQRWTNLERDAAECAIVVARKLSAALVRPEALVAETLRTTLADLAKVPKLKVVVHPTLAARMAEMVRDMQHADQPASITFETDDAMAMTDCRIVWSGGAIFRDSAELDRQIDAIINRALPARAEVEETLP